MEPRFRLLTKLIPSIIDKILFTDIAAGICTSDTWSDHFANDAMKVLWNFAPEFQTNICTTSINCHDFENLQILFWSFDNHDHANFDYFCKQAHDVRTFLHSPLFKLRWYFASSRRCLQRVGHEDSPSQQEMQDWVGTHVSTQPRSIELGLITL